MVQAEEIRCVSWEKNGGKEEVKRNTDMWKHFELTYAAQWDG